MKQMLTTFLGLALMTVTSSITHADEGEHSDASVQSGPADGYLPPFHVTKVAGAMEDGVDAGEELCYRCRNGSRPQVVVFTRSEDAQVTEMLKKLDAAMVSHEEDQLRVFVSVLAKDEEIATDLAKQLIAKSGAKRIPMVVPTDVGNGPGNYQIHPEAAVTVTFAADGQVTASHGFASGHDVCLDTVMEQVAKIVQ